MKYFFSACICLLVSISSFAQFKIIAESPAIEEPEDGFARLLLLKNGSTAFLRLNKKEGIAVRIYDANHRPKVDKEIETTYTHGRNKAVSAVFEINGDIVLFVYEIDGEPILYRMIIDGVTGKLKQNDQIARLTSLDLEERYSATIAATKRADFAVRKDPNSDHYALALVNRFDRDHNRRIEIVHYGPDNKEINRGSADFPGDKNDHLIYLDMVVFGKERVSLFASSYSDKGKEMSNSQVLMANLDATDKKLNIQKLSFTSDVTMIYGLAKYIPAAKHILLLSVAQAGSKKREYAAVMSFINPDNQKLDDGSLVFPEKVNGKIEELFGKKNGFQGMPESVFINSDGSFSIAYEEVTNYIVGSSGRSNFSELGNIAICNYDATGKELESYLIPKRQQVYGSNVQPFYHTDRERGATQLLVGDQYKSFEYLTTKSKNYVLLNDIEKNGETAKKGKVTMIRSVKDCDGFYFALGGTDIMPERQYFFGKADTKRENDLAVFTLSDYNPEQNVFVTLKLEKENRDSHDAKVVWLQPQ